MITLMTPRMCARTSGENWCRLPAQKLVRASVGWFVPEGSPQTRDRRRIKVPKAENRFKRVSDAVAS
jgi:hypothetical protein